MSRVVKQSTFLCDSEKRKYPHFFGEIYHVLSIVPKFFDGILRKRKKNCFMTLLFFCVC
jgi:hypothetical protein